MRNDSLIIKCDSTISMDISTGCLKSDIHTWAYHGHAANFCTHYTTSFTESMTPAIAAAHYSKVLGLLILAIL